MRAVSVRQKAVELRQQGKTYGEIQMLLGLKIAKSTLSYWCSPITLSSQQLNGIEEKISRGGEKGRAIALATKRHRREAYLVGLKQGNSFLKKLPFRDKDIAKLALAILYLAEGGKRQNGSIMFGNSDPGIVTFFLELLRFVYRTELSKFRCTLQCRADQDIVGLERFWSKVTHVPLSQFYRARVDARTVGVQSRRVSYRGVCRIDYFSAAIYNDLLAAGEVIVGNKKGP